MQETMCNFCLFFPACVERAVLQTGSPAGEWQSSGLARSCFLLCLLHIRLEKNWAAETQVLVLSFSPLLLFQYWPSLLSFFCVSHRGWLEPSATSLLSTKPDTPWQDFWFSLFHVELEVLAMCWLFPIQSLPGRQRQHLEQMLAFAIHEALKSWDGTHQKSSNRHRKQKGLLPQALGRLDVCLLA